MLHGTEPKYAAHNFYFGFYCLNQLLMLLARDSSRSSPMFLALIFSHQDITRSFGVEIFLSRFGKNFGSGSISSMGRAIELKIGK